LTSSHANSRGLSSDTLKVVKKKIFGSWPYSERKRRKDQRRGTGNGCDGRGHGGGKRSFQKKEEKPYGLKQIRKKGGWEGEQPLNGVGGLLEALRKISGRNKSGGENVSGGRRRKKERRLPLNWGGYRSHHRMQKNQELKGQNRESRGDQETVYCWTSKSTTTNVRWSTFFGWRA